MQIVYPCLRGGLRLHVYAVLNTPNAPRVVVMTDGNDQWVPGQAFDKPGCIRHSMAIILRGGLAIADRP